MMNRVISRSISLRFFISCILLVSFPCISLATMVQISEESTLTANVLSKKLANNKRTQPLSPPKNQFYSSLHTDLISPSIEIRNTAIKKQQAFFIQTDIKAIGKAWATKNLDNEYMQESLLAFKKTKLLYNKTDKFLTNLTQDLLLTLELEQLIQLTPSPKSEAQQKLYRSVASNTEIKTSKVIDYDEPDNIFLMFYKQIIKIETVVYLVVFLLFYSTLKWFFRQIFMKRY